jgi:hypothetical protein
MNAMSTSNFQLRPFEPKRRRLRPFSEHLAVINSFLGEDASHVFVHFTAGMTAKDKMDAVNQLLADLEAGKVKEAVVLSLNATETRWFQTLAGRVGQIVLFTDHRIVYYDVGSSPTCGSAYFYFGDRPELFSETFKQFGELLRIARAGPCARPLRQPTLHPLLVPIMPNSPPPEGARR